MSGPTATEVRQWIAELEREAESLQAKLDPLLKNQAAFEERLGIMRRLLASVTSQGAATNGSGGVNGSSGHDGDRSASVRDRVVNDAIVVLRDAGVPMHINEVHAEFIRRGFEVPGAGKPANITVHLSGESTIVSPSRGYYALAAPTASRMPVRDDTRIHRNG